MSVFSKPKFSSSHAARHSASIVTMLPRLSASLRSSAYSFAVSCTAAPPRVTVPLPQSTTVSPSRKLLSALCSCAA